MANFTVTFGIITPESAERGDYAESGFIDAHGYPVTALIGVETPDVAMTLREALKHCAPQEDNGYSFSECDGRNDYQTGANEIRSLHPPRDISAASYSRLKRLLEIR